MEFEAPFWAGHRPVDDPDPGRPPYPLPFDTLEMAEDALRALFGSTFEGYPRADDPDLSQVTLAGFSLR